ncbi:uncharacterized protein [Nicotiana tomentosiformis]|uniref:uncharacterized protein n=1 Tax=Nicotiana tomentosiformis TaxID=4098 RepID=UPI00388C9BE3
MKEGETIQEMYTRFTTLTNKLKSLERIILEEDRVEKILTRVLLVTWDSKITAIQESKNIATLKLDELIGNLTDYELRRQTMKMDVPKNKRSLALRITEGSDLEDDEMAMITKDFKKYLRRGKCPSRSESYNKPKVPEKQTNEGCYKSSDALSWLHEHHSRNRRGLGFGNLPPKWDPKSKYLTLPENKICTHCGKTGHYKSNALQRKRQVQVKGSSQIWYMDSDCSKHMTGNKNQFLSLEDLKGGNVSFGNEKKVEIIGVGKKHDDEVIGLVRNSNKTTAHTEAALEEGTGDGTGSST